MSLFRDIICQLARYKFDRFASKLHLMSTVKVTVWYLFGKMGCAIIRACTLFWKNTVIVADRRKTPCPPFHTFWFYFAMSCIHPICSNSTSSAVYGVIILVITNSILSNSTWLKSILGTQNSLGIYHTYHGLLTRYPMYSNKHHHTNYNMHWCFFGFFFCEYFLALTVNSANKTCSDKKNHMVCIIPLALKL